MDDSISRAMAIAEIEEYLHGLDSCISEPDLKLDGYRNGLQVAIRELKELPAVDAAPVVRCQNCKDYIDNVKHIDMACEYSGGPDFYCAAGERRDDGA